jgi:hypothetical protein
VAEKVRKRFRVDVREGYAREGLELLVELFGQKQEELRD